MILPSTAQQQTRRRGQILLLTAMRITPPQDPNISKPASIATDRNDAPVKNIIGEHIAKRPKRELPFTRPAQMRITDPQKSHKWIRGIIDTLYVLGFIGVSFGSMFLLQWGVNPDLHFAQVIANALPDTFGTNSASRRFILLLNVLLIVTVYLFLLFLCNSFYVSTGIIVVVVAVFSVANRIKINLRSEPVLPSDITLAIHNTKNVAGFIPNSSYSLIAITVTAIILYIILAVACGWLLGKAQPLHIASSVKRIGMQILISCAPAALFIAFVAGTSDTNAWGRQLATSMGDTPRMWDAKEDSQLNGTLYAFIRNSFTKVMDKPAGYSQQRMKAIASKYSKVATTINSTRSSNLTDQTVILILSESFSDPLRVPGVQLSEDPMPNLRSIMANTTSGLFLSSGYGGGTANLEYQALTGLSMANMDPSLNSPYQQLVPRQTSPYAFNQIWNQQGGGSVAIHPYSGSTYQRSSNYKKFGFQHFWTLDGPEYVKYKDRLGLNPYVSDESTYKDVLYYLNKDKKDKQSFIQVATMQNHMPYLTGYYSDPIKQTNGLGMNDRDETGNIEAYSAGVKRTDSATTAFLASIDKINRPITIIWYGDHLPGIYSAEMQNAQNLLTLHETNYFIWSNAASHKQGVKLKDAAYTSPNYLLAQGADQMNAKVSPYLALLTKLHQQIPAMEPPLNTSNWSTENQGKPVYIDLDGKEIDKLTNTQKELLNDYKLVTYDMTVGKNYLVKDGFLTAPSAADSSAASNK